MKISVRGRNDRLTKQEIRDIVSFAGHILLGKRLSNYIFVQIKSTKLHENEWGHCGPTDYDNFNHRNFEIVLNNGTGKRNQILTLLHEAVHLKQYARGELKCFDYETFKWLGKRVSISPDEYERLPWEIEAHRAEPVLFKLYNEYRKTK